LQPYCLPSLSRDRLGYNKNEEMKCKLIEKSRRLVAKDTWEETMRIQYQDENTEPKDLFTSAQLYETENNHAFIFYTFIGLIWFLGVVSCLALLTLWK